ncbi:MAG: CRISPR-associated endonuclease Cas2 [Bacteroidota bacterium]
MHIILVYDMGQKRLPKMLKLCRQYLHWIQNSVFEGEISLAQLKELEYSIQQLIEPEEDSVIIFKHRHKLHLEKKILGLEKSPLDNLL